MQAPAEEPRLKVVARIQGGAPLPAVAAGWKQALSDEADGFAVSVYVHHD